MRTLVILLATTAIVAAPEAQAKRRTTVAPYLQIDQTVLSDLKGRGGTQSYTTFSAGIDAATSGPRAEGQISYRYEYR